MVNLEHKLTVDDLIVEYMMYKVKNGYEPVVSSGEFVDFLLFFETKKTVYDSLYDGKELFNRFLERKIDHDWSITKNYLTFEREARPHMELENGLDDSSLVLKANYRLSDFDKSIINTYFMDNGMSRFDNFKGQVYEIRNIIGEWLERFPKRELNENVQVDDCYLIMGKYLSAEIIDNIWKAYINEFIKNGQWPGQCRDINKYLLDIDLAELIELKSIKTRLLELYEVLAKRIAILYSQDNKLTISSSNGSYLAHSNYELLIKGYEDLFKIAFGPYKSTFLIDMEKLMFTESHEIAGFYMLDDEPDVKTTKTVIGNAFVKKLVKKLDTVIENKE